MYFINTLRPRRNRRHFADDIFKCIFLNESVWIPIKISLNCVPKSPINHIPALVQIMAWRRPGDKLLSEAMVVSLPTHICVTRPQWVKKGFVFEFMTMRRVPSAQTHVDQLIVTEWCWKYMTSNGSWCMGIKGEMSGTVCVTFTWYMYIYELFIAFVCCVVCSLL